MRILFHERRSQSFSSQLMKRVESPKPETRPCGFMGVFVCALLTCLSLFTADGAELGPDKHWSCHIPGGAGWFGGPE
jgi:hypothetical protein